MQNSFTEPNKADTEEEREKKKVNIEKSAAGTKRNSDGLTVARADRPDGIEPTE